MPPCLIHIHLHMHDTEIIRSVSKNIKLMPVTRLLKKISINHANLEELHLSYKTSLYPKVDHVGAIGTHICKSHQFFWFYKKTILSNQPACSDHADWISPGHHFVSKFHGKGGRWTHKTWEASFVRLSHLSRTEKPKTGLFISLLSLAQVISGFLTSSDLKKHQSEEL